ncbi:MAG: metallophosphoesterase, partial [Gemmatimonadota bacterium]|nr:metallophosphoesterase [Gemmatimonadota bacterium]
MPDRKEAPPESERAQMVGWFDPSQLLQTAMQVVVSTAFADNSDRRILDSVIHHTIEPCDYSDLDEIWIDYVADTGDGWNSTYAIAHAVAQPTLTITSDGKDVETRRGRIMVFGGDEVYPVASRAGYEQRLIAPYETALPHSDAPNPTVFAVAGNHDWYDSLVAFSRYFCSGGQRWFAGWRTRQSLSYFVCRLPHGWWLVGTDVQLHSDIDEPQLAYFREIEKLMGPDDKVILCTAEPHWVYEAKYEKFDPHINQENLTFLERKIFGDRIAVFLSGDLHHYRRHADELQRQKITAGGGGAFLYPTHSDVEEVKMLKDGFALRDSYPSIPQSRTLANKLLSFHRINPTFGFATAFLYVLLAWAVQVDLAALSTAGLLQVIHSVAKAILNSQIAVLWGVLLFFGFFFFTDTRSPRFKLWGGMTHATSHLVSVFLLGWFATWITVAKLGLEPRGIAQLLGAGLIIFVGGYLIGPILMGLYLFIALNVFHRHAGEFSAVKCEDFK